VRGDDGAREKVGRVCQLDVRMNETVIPAMGTGPDNIKLGVEFVGMLFALWSNLQYLRFMRFWIEPPYKIWTVAIFRLFFALCFGGALSTLLQDLIQTSRSKAGYLEALKFSLEWGLVMVALMYLAEGIKRKRTTESENTSRK